MYTIGVDRETKEKLVKLGNLSMSKKVRALLRLCEKYYEECMRLMAEEYGRN
jgi:hypothetical protein